MDWIKDAREAQGLTLVELSKRTGIDVGSLSRYENGRRDPSFRRALLVARVLGVSLDLLPCDEPASAGAVGTEVAA